MFWDSQIKPKIHKFRFNMIALLRNIGYHLKDFNISLLNFVILNATYLICLFNSVFIHYVTNFLN